MENEDLHNAMLELSVALGNPVLDIPAGSSVEAALVREATRRILQLPLVPWQKTRAISTLPNTKLTPTVVLGRSLEKAQHGKIKSVWVGIHWADSDQFDYDYSSMQVRDLSLHRLVIERRLNNVAFGSDDTNETLKPAS
jgi:hypothetical protein